MRILFAGGLVLIASTVFGGQQTDAEVRQLSARIDQLLQRRWQESGVTPADAASDAEFMRRAWLDIAGKIPPAADVQDFLSDESPDKRSRLVDDLLNGPNYVMNFANLWRSVMMPEADSNFQIRFLLPGFESWLRTRLTQDVKYDELVREILTARLQGVNAFQTNGSTPIAFYQAKETKPENLAAATSRMFLGIRIECAQCHDHPFDEWSQKDFWGYAAFFATMQRQQRGANGFLAQLQEFFNRRTLKVPDTDELVEPTYLDGASPAIPSGTSPRGTLADWVTSKDNPYFARTVANRLWGHFFGPGIVDPVDDFSDSNPPSHPELLDLLATELADHDFDLKFLIRGIAGSRAYQLSSRVTPGSEEVDPQLFSRMAVKGLTGEQFYDSLAQAIGQHVPFSFNRNAFNRTPRNTFVEDFSDSGSSPTERQKSVLQALSMMNGRIVGGATGVPESITLAAVADYPLFSTAQRIDALFMATLTRKPEPYELERLTAWVESGGTEKDTAKALSDVLWALLNSNEFSSNH